MNIRNLYNTKAITHTTYYTHYFTMLEHLQLHYTHANCSVPVNASTDTTEPSELEHRYSVSERYSDS